MSNPYNDVPLVQWDRDDRLIVYMPNVSGVPTIPWITPSGKWALWTPNSWVSGPAAIAISLAILPLGLYNGGSDHYTTTMVALLHPDGTMIAAVQDDFDSADGNVYRIEETRDDRVSTSLIIYGGFTPNSPDYTDVPTGTFAGAQVLRIDSSGYLYSIGTITALPNFYFNLRKSTNKGDSWTLLNSFNTSAVMPNSGGAGGGPLWVSEDGQHICYQVLAFNDDGYNHLFWSADGGATVNQSIVEAISQTFSDPYPYQMQCMWTGTYWLAFSNDAGFTEWHIRKSADGSSWSTATTILAGDEQDQTADQDHGFYAANQGGYALINGVPIYPFKTGGVNGIYRSQDGGTTWDFLATTPNIDMFSAQFDAVGNDLYIKEVSAGRFWKLPSAGSTVSGTLTPLASLPA